MLDFLKQPYPLQRNTRNDLLFALGTGLFVGWFLVTFQPNDTNDWTHPYKYPFLWGYGAIVFVGMLLMRFLTPRLIPRFFKEKNWTVGKQIFYLVLSFVVAFSACYIYFIWFFEYPFNWSDYAYFASVCSTIGVFPLAAYVMLNYIWQLKKYQTGAAAFNSNWEKGNTFSASPDLMSLKDENGKIQLRVSANQIYFIQSSLNYMEVFYQKDQDAIQKILIRNSLKGIQEQLPQPPFFRSHRSYIVNLEKVVELSGNAQGYKLHFETLQELIPVSRSQSKVVLEKLSFLKSA